MVNPRRWGNPELFNEPLNIFGSRAYQNVLQRWIEESNQRLIEMWKEDLAFLEGGGWRKNFAIGSTIKVKLPERYILS